MKGMKVTEARKEADEKKERYLDALEKSLGIITTATRAAGVPRSTLYTWLEKDKDFAARADEVTETQIDYVESQLLQRIKEGDTTAIIFYLKTKGKKRGYGEVEKIRDTTIKVNVVEE